MTYENEKSYEKRINVCCHRVEIRYWDFEHELDDDLMRALVEEGEHRSKECICANNPCSSGELNCLYDEEEIRGWWEIVD
jgi:hypothetical protein